MIAANQRQIHCIIKLVLPLGFMWKTWIKNSELIDSLGNAVPFEIFKTEILHSILPIVKHMIALTYITHPYCSLTPLDIISCFPKQNGEEHEK